jgi:uncharacterized protein YggT (Ycf19 family)
MQPSFRHAVAVYVKSILSLFEVLLAIRVALKFLNASPKAAIVDFIYKLTDAIILPFSGIFSNSKIATGGVIDFVTIAAMIGYPIVVYIFLELLELKRKPHQAAQLGQPPQFPPTKGV